LSSAAPSSFDGLLVLGAALSGAGGETTAGGTDTAGPFDVGGGTDGIGAVGIEVGAVGLDVGAADRICLVGGGS